MSNITIFGQGNMGKAIQSVFEAAGQTVNFIGKEADGVVGDIAVLAVPYGAVESIAANYKEALAGKIVIDITNPVNFDNMDELVTPAGSSAAEEIAKLLPESTIVKGFNTIFAANIASRKVGENQGAVQLASDDEEAKVRVAKMIEAGGLATVDAGSLKRSRELEAMGFLAITLAVREQISWVGGYALVK
ncbi:NADPH-dependent F420 reductase [Streptococcus sp. DD12]|uniref:NADPH-dependent F420 reductase n=1 Tax=Streptococcus sp. DD12 TaxID=1777880 RepID=UPI00079B81C5|nr:NADPH-dependent F420 reductase [Streptococcus sp. DD12]KXT75243.1 Oxidoreductase [Streptococcus sp. DD12]